MKFFFAGLMIGAMLIGCIKPVQATLVYRPEVIAGVATADTTGTAAAATIAAVLSATPAPTTPPSTVTPQPVPTATPDAAATQASRMKQRATAVTATLTAQPTRTPHLAATATARAAQVATAIAVTLTARARLTPTNTATPKPTPTSAGERAVVDADGKLNVRAGPEQHFPILLQLKPGDEVKVLGRLEDASWVQIQVTNGRVGWVSAAYIKSTRAIYTYPVVTPAAPPVTATPATIACPYPAAPEVTGAWTQTEMGCATGPAAIVWAAYDPFERGFMVWRRDTDTLYVFFENGRWQAMLDKWDGKTQPRSRGAPPPGLQAPVRGSGWVWGNNDALFQSLGWATDKQKGFCALVQTFAQGFLLQSSTVEFCHEEKLYNFAREGGFGLNFILAHNSGYWRR